MPDQRTFKLLISCRVKPHTKLVKVGRVCCLCNDVRVKLGNGTSRQPCLRTWGFCSSAIFSLFVKLSSNVSCDVSYTIQTSACLPACPLKVMDAYIAKKNLDRSRIRFLFDGNRVNDDDTPEKVCMGRFPRMCK